MDTSTVDFILPDDYRARLDSLVQKMTLPNRSEFLKQAIEVMERFDSAQDLATLQGYGEAVSRTKGTSIEDVGRLQGSSLDEYPADIRTWAESTIADYPLNLPVSTDEELHPKSRLAIESIAEMLGLFESTT